MSRSRYYVNKNAQTNGDHEVHDGNTCSLAAEARKPRISGPVPRLSWGGQPKRRAEATVTC